MNPGPVITVRDNHVITSPNHTLRNFRNEAAAAIRKAHLDPETEATVWALVLAAEGWDDLAEWVHSALGRS